MNDQSSTAAAPPSFSEEARQFWTRLPSKGLFAILFVAWVALFHFLGNSTLGYINTTSLFRWIKFDYDMVPDDQIGYLMPLVVLGLLWWKRQELEALAKRIWWPALGLVVAGLVVHILGFLVQQTRLSIIGFLVGLFGLTGLVWGAGWLRATFFPFFLLGFCVPLGNTAEKITFPLRLLATKISVLLSHLLGINVVQQGTSIWEPSGRFQYEVAAACGGIRSLTAFLAFSMILGFVMLKGPWRRMAVVLSAFPLAVVSNVVRLLCIIIAAEAVNQEAGNWVHENWFFSLLPYAPALLGVVLLVRFLEEKPRKEGV